MKRTRPRCRDVLGDQRESPWLCPDFSLGCVCWDLGRLCLIGVFDSRGCHSLSGLKHQKFEQQKFTLRALEARSKKPGVGWALLPLTRDGGGFRIF